MNIDKILDKVSELTNVERDDILSKKRTYEVCEARNIFIYMCRTILGLTHKSIAVYMRRTRQTITHSVTIFNAKLDIYKNLDAKVEGYKNSILEETL